MTESNPSRENAVLLERRDAVLIVTLNRPRASNAIDLAITRGLCDAIEALDADPELNIGVLTGAGGKFSAGMDLKAFLAGEPIWTGGEDGRGMRRLVTEPARKPTIAAVEGFAVAGGFELALSCDLLVAGRSARFGVPEVSRSLVAAGGALRQLPRRAGPGRAMKLALTGELIDGASAREAGLVDEAVDDGQALDAALGLAAKITANGPLATIATKRILRDQAEWSEEEFWARQEEIVAPVFASEDAREGSRAFAEKRDPVWRGR